MADPATPQDEAGSGYNAAAIAVKELVLQLPRWGGAIGALRIMFIEIAAAGAVVAAAGSLIQVLIARRQRARELARPAPIDTDREIGVDEKYEMLRVTLVKVLEQTKPSFIGIWLQNFFWFMLGTVVSLYGAELRQFLHGWLGLG